MAAYVDLGTFKEAVGITDTVDDADLQRALDASREWIDNFCGRTFSPLNDTSAHIYDPSMYDRLSIDDALSVSEVANDTNFDGTFAGVLPSSLWILYPMDVGQPGTTTQGGYTEIRLRPSYGWLWGGSYWWDWQSDQVFMPGRQVRVTASWGYVGSPQPPASIAQANILLANRYFRRQSAPFGIVESAQLGELERVPASDPDVLSLLGAYRAPDAYWVIV